ncbi:MAG: MarR family transcriptional regulator [Pseudomonadota bacterium]
MPDSDTPKDPFEMAYQVDRLMRRMNAGIEARAPLFDTERVGPIGGMILLTIAEHQPLPMQQIAEIMARDKGQLSRTVSMLERRGMVMRTPNDRDQRSTLLRLTDKGDEVVAVIKRTLTEVLETILDPLSSSEQQQLQALLGKL